MRTGIHRSEASRRPKGGSGEPSSAAIALPAAASRPRTPFADLAITPANPGAGGATIQCNRLDKAESESGAEEKLKRRMLLRRQQLLRSQPDRSGGSATQAHLDTRFVDSRMQVRGPISGGVERRFMTPTEPVPEDNAGEPVLRRNISPEQAGKYREITHEVIANEKKYSGSHVPLYHAQDPRMRIAQDVYKRVYARHHAKELPADFHFLRFPGPDDKEYKDSLPQFLHKDMDAHGMIDDNINPTKGSIVSANLSAFGGIGHPGEETFHYFQTGKGQTPPPVTSMMEGFLPKFGLDPSGAAKFYEQAEKLNDTPEGNLMQIMVPRGKVDQVAYAAHPHGMPHDDRILDKLHEMGSIRYPKADGVPTREKMNDEVTRKLAGIRDVWSRRDRIPDLASLPVTGGTPGPSILKGANKVQRTSEQALAMEKRAKDREDALLLRQADRLHAYTTKRFKTKAYKLSSVMDRYVRDPHSLQHPEAAMQADRVASNPEHFSGQGVRSHHDNMRIQNRSNFLQARVHMSEQGMLNPESGVRVIRHTTMTPEQGSQYQALVDRYVEELFKSAQPPKPKKMMSKL